MLRRRRKNDIKSDMMQFGSGHYKKDNVRDVALRNSARDPLRDYIKFAFYCMLLAVPLYAITISILKHDWVMVFVDALIVPVGFVHGLLLLFGYVS